MGNLTIDHIGDEPESATRKTNSPLVIALACALLLLALFVAVMEAEGQKAEPEAQVSFGSITGRVIAGEPGQGTGGVRVLVRRVHAGIANFYFDRITNADGSFELQYLLPGRYTLEVDPRTVPDAFLPAYGVDIVDVITNHVSKHEVTLQHHIAAQTGTRKPTKE